ncbi:MAG: hypothetical protein HOO06_00520 [Bdellovibrionaceae bacterium]|jgi:hypothetical protein|nr:hypothetical protein [Pseudobdellovibrionaceae bacterium]
MKATILLSLIITTQGTFAVAADTATNLGDAKKVFNCVEEEGGHAKGYELLDMKGGKIALRVFNNSEYDNDHHKNTPLQADPSLPITTGDLGLYQNKAEIFKKLGSTFQMELNGNDCTYDIDHHTGFEEIMCFLREKEDGSLWKVNDLEFKTFAFFVYTQKSRSKYSRPGGTLTYMVGWDFNINNQNHTVTIPIDVNANTKCKIDVGYQI